MKKLCSNENIELSIDELFTLAINKSKEWNITVVLKQSRTVIVSPTEGQKIDSEENPLLSTAGTGDVLSGIISGLVAQRVEPFNAACAGVYIHSKAAKNLVSSYLDSGMMASDLLPQIPISIANIKNTK